MADVYRVTMGIIVVKEPAKEVVAVEDFYFNDLTFSKMANVSDQFYELITKLQKVK